MRTVLHVGCGPKTLTSMGPGFRDGSWREVRLDIDPAARPDVVGTITDLSALGEAAFDALWSSHNLEHVYDHEVDGVLKGFRRVLKPDGFLVLTCPDLEAVCRRVAEAGLEAPLYVSPAGPIQALDVLFGHRPSMAQGQSAMAHRTGFSLETLSRRVQAAGFPSVYAARRPSVFDLWVLGSAVPRSGEDLKQMFTTSTGIEVA